MLNKNKKLKNPYELNLLELPLKEIELNNKYVYYISEDDLETYMIRNYFNIYNLNDESIKYYEDVINKNLVLDYGILYEVAEYVGLTLVSTDEEDDIENKKLDDSLLRDEDLEFLKNISSSEIIFLISKEYKLLYECDIKNELKKLKDKKRELTEESRILQNKINILINRCSHEDLTVGDDWATCNTCDKSFHWYCPTSPTKECDYEQDDGSYDEECCRYCGKPEERK